MFDIPILIAPLVAILIGLCAVPMARRIALACGFLDAPDRQRKFHAAPIALGGGIAVWLATWTGWGVSLFCPSPVKGSERDAGWFLAALGVSSLYILCLGIIDDRHALRARHKLAGQIVAAVILLGLGIRIDALSCFGVVLKLGIFAYPATVFWILLVVNAFNLIDGMDGFCGSLGLIASIAIAFLAYRSGRVEDAVFTLALAGALAAFLMFNLPPARIFLGDAGSMTIGLMISALSVRSCSAGPKTAVLMMPAVALSMLPILDVITAVGRRWLTGHSIFAPDRGHIHHCLRGRLGSPVATIVVAVILATVGAGGAVLAKAYSMGDPVAFSAIVLSVGLLTCTNTFGAAESGLLLGRLKGVLTPVPAGLAVGGDRIGYRCYLCNIGDWAVVWDAMVREGEASGMYSIELAIDMTASGETYHRRWSSLKAAECKLHWSIVHTLYTGDVVAGMITVAGHANARGSHYHKKAEKLVQLVADRRLSEDALLSASEPTPPRSGNLLVNPAMS